MLAIADSWPGQMRTICGDHERFVETYFSQYKGYYFTGDGCRRDADGYYWITGRVDDVINVSGHRMGTAEVEIGARRPPEGRRGRGGRLPARDQGPGHLRLRHADDRRGVHRGAAQGARRTGSRKEIGPIASPDLIQWAPACPRPARGKIMRRILRKIAENDYGAPRRHLDARRPRRRRRPDRQPHEQGLIRRPARHGTRCEPAGRRCPARAASADEAVRVHAVVASRRQSTTRTRRAPNGNTPRRTHRGRPELPGAEVRSARASAGR